MKKLLTVLFLTSIFVLGMNITRAESTSVNIDDTRACTLEYMPVCGEIQVYCIKAPCPPIRTTYGNKCMADAAGAKIISQGECATPSTKPCTDEYMPVCGSDGETYGNKCVADAAGTKIVSQGECVALPTKACTKEYMPVCGGDGETYGNKCVADAAGAKIVYSGECVGERGDINPGEGTVYRNVASLLDKSYLAWKYTPIQAYNYTQTIVDKIDNLLQTSKLKPLAYNKYVQIKRLLQVYMKVEHILE